MSIPVIEWGSGSYRGFDPVSRKVSESKSLADLVNQIGRPTSCGLALSRRVALVKQVSLPDVSREQMASILGLQLDQMFPVAGGDMASDFYVASKNGQGVKAVVVAVRNKVLRNAVEELKANGVTVAWTAPTSLAAASALQEAGRRDGVVAELTGEGVGFDVVVDGTLVYSRTGTVPESPEEFQNEISRTRRTAKAPDAPLIAIGGLRSDLAEQTLVPTALEYLSRHEPTVRLELPEARALRSFHALRSRRTLAILLVAAALIAWFYVWSERDDRTKRLQKDTRRWEREVANKVTLDTELKKRIKELEGPDKMVGRAFEPAQPPSDVLVTLNEATSPELWLTGVTMERGRPVVVRGTATSHEAVAAFVQELGLNPRLRDVTLQFANDGKIDDTPVVLFAINAHVMGNYPVIEKTKGGRAK